MKNNRILFFLAFFVALDVSAIIDIQGRVWLLSSISGTNATVAETLSLIENNAKSEKWNEAIALSKELGRRSPGGRSACSPRPCRRGRWDS